MSSAVSSTIAERRLSPLIDMYMHHLRIAGFHSTSGAHMFPLTSGFVDWLDQSFQMSAKIEA